MSNDSDYRPTNMHRAYQLQPQLDTNLTLFRLNNKSTVSMDLAKSVSVDENKRTMRVELKRSCGWSDGTRIDAHQMLKGIRLYFEQTQYPSIFSSLFKKSEFVLNGEQDGSILGIRVIDDFTLEFDLVSPPDLLMQALSYPAFTPAPIHLIQKDPKNWPIKSIVRVSSGAYKAVSYEDHKKIEMVPNHYFCEGVPINFDRVYFIGEYQSTMLINDILEKKIDASFKVDKDQVIRQIKNTPHSTGFTLGSYPEDVTISLFINTNHIIEKKIRRAISLVMDYSLINRIISPKGTSHSNLGISVPFPGYNQMKSPDSSLPIDQKIVHAKRLMTSLGYGPNKTLKLNFLGSKEKIYARVQLAVASMLSQIHIDTNIDQQSSAQYWGNLSKGNYDLVLNGWSADIHDPSNFLEGTLADLIIPSDLSKKLTEQLNTTYSIYDKNLRFNKLAQIEQSILKSFSLVPLFRYQNYYLLRPDFKLLDEPIMSARNMINENCSPSLASVKHRI